MSQECFIDMDVDSLDQKTVRLFPEGLNMIQPKDMTLFTITSSVLQRASNSSTGIQMRITLKRKIMSEMMTTYFPSLLLMMITYATTFFKPFFFEAALSVNLTTMLVMTTIFISKMESLPPTSATKMIDYWLILCQLVPFAEVVILTAMEYIREDATQKEDMNGDAMFDGPQVVPTIIVVDPLTPGRVGEEKLNLTKNPLFVLKMIGEQTFFASSRKLNFLSCRDQRPTSVCALLLCLIFWNCCQVLL